METFDPWIYPSHLALSSDDILEQKVENIIHENTVDLINLKQYKLSKSKFCSNSNIIKKELGLYNEATKHIAGHHLYSLKQSVHLLSKVVSKIQSTKETNIMYSTIKQFLKKVINEQTNDKSWQQSKFDYLDDLFTQTTSSIAQMTFEKLPVEAFIILAKRLYLLEKVRHNNRKQTSRFNQREQISVVPWSITKQNWQTASDYIKKRSLQIRKQTHVSSHPTQKLDSEKQKTQFPFEKRKQPARIRNDCKISNQHQIMRDFSCRLWNAAKMLKVTATQNKVKVKVFH